MWHLWHSENTVWRARKLTANTKITVLQSFALAQMYFTASVVYVSHQAVADFHFLPFFQLKAPLQERLISSRFIMN